MSGSDVQMRQARELARVMVALDNYRPIESDVYDQMEKESILTFTRATEHLGRVMYNEGWDSLVSKNITTLKQTIGLFNGVNNSTNSNGDDR